MLKPFIKSALERIHLSDTEAEAAMGIVMGGNATPAQIAAWLIALRQKGETPMEIAGFARAMRATMVPVDNLPEGAIDTCGTGGDGLATFNISTAAALIAAACGVPVAKHGNRAVSSKCGSADVLAALGFEIDPGVETASRALTDTGFAFLFAPRFHPAMKHAIGPRREIGVRTVFNLLGPICNPASVRRQVMGVYDPAWLVPMATALGALGAEHVLVVNGPHGADEFLALGDNRVAEWNGTEVREYTMSPADLGVDMISLDDLKGSDAEGNATIIRDIAKGAQGPRTETALLNAGAALYVSGKADSIPAGIALAREGIKTGRLHELLVKAVAATQIGA